MQVAVLGLGRFGSHLAETLDDLGHEVLAIDMDEQQVNDLVGKVTDARIADITDLDTLRALSLSEVDVAVVATGDLEASVLAMMNLMTLAVNTIYAKASTDNHERILRILGAKRVIRPERDGAERYAHIIRVSNAVDLLPLTDSYGIGIFPSPLAWVMQTVEHCEEQLGRLRLLGIVRDKELLFNPVRSETIQPGDRLVLSGEDQLLGQLPGGPAP